MGKSKMSLKKIFQGANIEEEMYLKLYLCFCYIMITKIYIFFLLAKHSLCSKIFESYDDWCNPPIRIWNSNNKIR